MISQASEKIQVSYESQGSLDLEAMEVQFVEGAAFVLLRQNLLRGMELGSLHR